MHQAVTPAIEVWIDDERWRAVATLDGAAPDDAVFALDADRGTIRFGDGVQGRLPRHGASVRVGYRTGSGKAGLAAWFEAQWPFADALLSLSTSRTGEVLLRHEQQAPPASSSLERMRYFDGQILTAADLIAEQDYFRAKLRRHNLGLHGHGIVSGLDLSVSQGSWKDAPLVVVAAGSAIAPDGEDIIVPEVTAYPISNAAQAWYVTLRFVVRDANPVTVPGAPADRIEPTRVEEGFAISLETAIDTDSVALARIIKDGSGWSADASFEPPRAR
jgi:hypothetical protein